MKDWFAVFAVALVIIVGSAAGLSGTVAFLLAFFITWYLLSAREIGFAQARDALGIKLLPPVWQRSNWLWLERVFEDSGKLFKSATAALVVVAVAAMFQADVVYGAAAIIAAYYASEIVRGRNEPPPRLVRIPDAGAHPSEPATPAIPAPASPALAPTEPGPGSRDRAAAPPAHLPAAPITTSLVATAAPAAARVPAPAAAAAPAPAAATPAPAPAPPAGRSDRVALRRARGPRKPPTRNQRPPLRATAERKPAAGKRPLRKPAQRPVRTQRALPSRKPDIPVSLRPHKPLRRRPALRQRRRLRRPMTLVPRNSPAPAAAADKR